MIRFGPFRDEPFEYEGTEWFECEHCGLEWASREHYERHVEEDHRDA